MKTELICEYCGNEIGENDKKCPNCGANCSNITKAYRKEKEEDQKLKEEAATKEAAKIVGGVFAIHNIIGLITAVVIIAIFVVAGINIAKQFKTSGSGVNNKANVGYQEKARTSDLTAELLSYDLYEYKSEHFDTYNTKEGFQKIAFEFEIENLSKYSNDAKITLKADGYNVNETELHIDPAFATLVQGKSEYPGLDVIIIDGNDTQKGYIGFEVPKDKKELLFRIGDDITIKMDNPVYSE